MPQHPPFKHSEKTLRALLDEAIVDAYGDDEQFSGVLITLQDNLPFPFPAEIVGETVKVVDIVERDSSLYRGIVARVQRGGKEYSVGLAELTVPPKIATNQYWEMYLLWLEGF